MLYLAALLIIGGAAAFIFLAARLVHGRRARMIATLAIIAVSALIWTELAVGIFD